jgi:EamA-like transporter family protein
MDLGGWNRVCLASGGVALRHPSHFGDECDITGQLCRAFGAASLMALPASCGSPEHNRVRGARLSRDSFTEQSFAPGWGRAAFGRCPRIDQRDLLRRLLGCRCGGSGADQGFSAGAGELRSQQPRVSYFRSAWWGETASVGRRGLDLAHRVGRDFAGHALGRIPPAQAAIGLLIQPVSAALFAWVLFHESLSGLQLFGGALVLIAITAVRLFE